MVSPKRVPGAIRRRCLWTDTPHHASLLDGAIAASMRDRERAVGVCPGRSCHERTGVREGHGAILGSLCSMSEMGIEPSAGRWMTDALLAWDPLAMFAGSSGCGLHSPVADYECRERIGVVLTAITQVVAGLRPSGLIQGPDETLLASTAELEGNAGDGFLLATGGTDRAILELTLMGQAAGHAPRRRRPHEGAARRGGPGPVLAGRAAGRVRGRRPRRRVSFFLHGRRRAGGQICIATRTRRPSSCTRVGSASPSTARRSRRGPVRS